MSSLYHNDKGFSQFPPNQGYARLYNVEKSSGTLIVVSDCSFKLSKYLQLVFRVCLQLFCGWAEFAFLEVRHVYVFGNY